MKRTELLEALEKVKPGLATQEMIEQTTSFAFIEGKVITYSDEISISYPIKDLDITGAIKAEQLYKLLEKLTTDEIELKVKGAEIIITSNQTKAGLPLQAEIILPTIETKELKWKPLPKDFLEGIAFCLFSCSKDMSRPVLVCIHVKEDGTIESTDNYRLSSIKLKDEQATPSFLLPATSAEKLIHYEVKKIALGKGWIHFKTDDDCIFSARTYTGEFPDVKMVIDSFEKEGMKKVPLPNMLPTILERAMIFSKGEFGVDEGITLFFEKGKMKIQAKGQGGWFEEKIDIDYKDEQVIFSINPTYLKDICTKTDYLKITKDMVKFEGDNWTHIAALKLDNE